MNRWISQVGQPHWCFIDLQRILDMNQNLVANNHSKTWFYVAYPVLNLASSPLPNWLPPRQRESRRKAALQLTRHGRRQHCSRRQKMPPGMKSEFFDQHSRDLVTTWRIVSAE